MSSTNSCSSNMIHNQPRTRRTRHSQKQCPTRPWLCLSFLALTLLSSHSHSYQGSCGSLAHATPLTNAPNQLWKRIPQVEDGSNALGRDIHTPYGKADNGQFETGNHRRKRHQPGPSGQEKKEEARRSVMSKRSLFSGIYRDDSPRSETQVSQLQEQNQQGFGRDQEVVAQRLRESWYRRPAVMGEPNVLSDSDYQGRSQGDKYTAHSNNNNNTPERYTPDLYDDWVEDEHGEEDDEGSTIIEPHYPSLDLFEEDDGDDIGIRDGDMTVDSQIEEEEEERYRRMMSQRRQYQQQQNHPGWTVDEWEEELETDMDELMDWIEDEDHHVVNGRKPRMQQEPRDDRPLQRGYLFPF